MRWLIPALLLISLNANAQNTDDTGITAFAKESSRTLDLYDFVDPEFKWDMEGRVQAALNEGINYLKSGQPNLALPQFQEAIKLDRKSWVAHFYKGVCNKQLNRVQEATLSLLAADGLNKKNFVIYIELGKTYDLMYNYPQAEKFLMMAAEVKPTSALPQYYLGNHYLLFNQRSAAHKAYEKSLLIDSMALDAEVKLGVLLSIDRPEDWFAKTLAHVDDVLRKDSLHKQALIFHGMLTDTYDRNLSIKDWDKLVRLDPGNIVFRFARGATKAQLERFEEAFQDFRKVVNQMEVNENRFTGSQTTLDKLINLTYAGYYVMANVYGLPDEDAANIKKAYSLLCIEAYDGALSSIWEVKDADKLPLCLFLQGVIYEHKGQHRGAFNAYNNALKFDNDILDAHKKRGVYYTELSQWKFAIADFTEMLRINPEAFVAYRLRGVSKYHNADFKGAIEDFTKYIDRDSSDTEIFGYRAMAYHRDNQLLPRTYDLMKAQMFDAMPTFDSVKNEVNQLIVKRDTTRALYWLSRFSSAEQVSTAYPLLYIDVLIKAKKWAVLENFTQSTLEANTKQMLEMAAGPNYTDANITYIRSAQSMAITNQGGGSLKDLTAAIKKDNKNPTAYLNRAKAHLRLENKEDAIKDLKKAKDLGSKEAAEILAKLP